MRAGEAT